MQGRFAHSVHEARLRHRRRSICMRPVRPLNSNDIWLAR